jgi:hypothetical protein
MSEYVVALSFPATPTTVAAFGTSMTVTVGTLLSTGGGGGGTSVITKDEGVVIVTPATTVFDFVGPGVTATAAGSAVTVTIPGGSAGGTVTSVGSTTPALVVGTPTSTPSLSIANAVAGGAAGLLTGTDKTKLDNTSGTNTGDQSLTALVTGPASAVAGNLPSFSGVTGKVVADSGVVAANVVVTGDARLSDTRTPTAGSVTTSTLATIAANALWANTTAGVAAPTVVTLANFKVWLALGTSDIAGFPTALPPNGAASGDLSGSFPSPTVAKVNGVAVTTTPTSGYVLTATGAAAATWQAPAGTTAATNTEAQTGTDTTKFITPASMASQREASRFQMPSGALAETYDRRARLWTASSGLTTGKMGVTPITLFEGMVVTSATFVAAGALNTGTNQWFALYDAGKNLLRVTNDDTSTAWAANTAKTLTFASTYTVTATGLFYIGCCQVATTPATLMGVATAATGVAQLTPYMSTIATGSFTNPASAPNPFVSFSIMTADIYGFVS